MLRQKQKDEGEGNDAILVTIEFPNIIQEGEKGEKNDAEIQFLIKHKEKKSKEEEVVRALKGLFGLLLTNLFMTKRFG